MQHRTRTYTAKLSASTHKRLESFLEQQRHLYNAALEERIGAYIKAGKSIGLYDQQKSLTLLRADQEFNQYDLKCQRSCLFTLDRAFKAFFRRVKTGKKPGFPRFKGKDRGVRSFSTDTPRIRTSDTSKWNTLSIKGIGRFRFKGEIEGAIKKVYIIKTPLRVAIHLLTELPDVNATPQVPIGIDVGIQARVTLSTGQRWTKHEVDRERLTVLQQCLAKAKRGPNTRKKRKIMLTKEYRRVREREHDMLHEMTAELIKITNCWYVENLNVQGMMGNHHLARSIAEQQWSTFVAMLTYKAASAGGWGRKVDPQYTSQDCSRCGYRVKKSLSDRQHDCPVCHLSIDRDWNAALNILKRGIETDLASGGNQTIPSVAIGGKNSILGLSSI